MDDDLLLTVLAIVFGLILVAGIFIYNSVFKDKLLTQEEIEFLNNHKSEEEKSVVEYEENDYQKTIYNIDNIDNKPQYASSLSDLLEMNDFKFEDEQHDF